MVMTMNPLLTGMAQPIGYGLAPAYADGQLAPQGLFGNILGGIAPTLGGAIGGLFGNQGLGQQLGQVASPFARLLPFGVDPQTGAAAPATGGGQSASLEILWPQNTLDPETRAAQEFLQTATSAVLRKLYDYLSANRAQYNQLADCDPLVKRSAELLGQSDYDRAFVQAYQAYRFIAMLRQRVPGLPAL